MMLKMAMPRPPPPHIFKINTLSEFRFQPWKSLIHSLLLQQREIESESALPVRLSRAIFLFYYFQLYFFIFSEWRRRRDRDGEAESETYWHRKWDITIKRNYVVYARDRVRAISWVKWAYWLMKIEICAKISARGEHE